MSRVVERARRLLARPGAWLAAEGDGYGLRLGPDRRSRINLSLNETEFRALVQRPGLRARPEGGWTMLALIFTVIVVVIALSGSLWVMYHLNTNMMPTHDMTQMGG